MVSNAKNSILALIEALMGMFLSLLLAVINAKLYGGAHSINGGKVWVGLIGCRCCCEYVHGL